MTSSATDHPPIPTATARRLAGSFIALVSLFGTWTSWSQAVEHGRVLRAASMAAPAFAVIGIALVLFPGYREERIARGEDISQLQGYALITPRWWAVVALAVAAGVAWGAFLGYGPVNALPLPTWRDVGLR
jgi:hypothetical protein